MPKPSHLMNRRWLAVKPSVVPSSVVRLFLADARATSHPSGGGGSGGGGASTTPGKDDDARSRRDGAIAIAPLGASIKLVIASAWF